MNLSVTLSLAFFTIFLDCSVEYISLKKLCHYGDQTVPEAIQKKAYGILAPLFSQRPWTAKYSEPKIEYGDWSRFQAIVYAFNLHVFPQELVFKIFNKGLFMMRQYKKFDSQVSFIPFLYNNNIWALQNEYGHLKRHVGYSAYWDGSDWKDFTSSDVVNLSCPVGFNFVTNPLAVLKTQQKDMVVCLFSSGFSFVDLNTMKEIWSSYNHNHFFPNKKGSLIAGYNDYVCFLNSNKDLNFYKILFLMSEENPSYVIKNNQKFNIMKDKNYDFLCCMNSKNLFYRVVKQEYVHLYCICFTETSTEEHVFYTLSEDNYFSHFACNDVYLIAKDNHRNLYIWDLTKNDQPPQVISSNNNIIEGKFWLDSCSNRILTQRGVFKIENVFEGLPKIPVDIIDIKIENTKKINLIIIIQSHIRRMRAEDEFYNKNTFFKKIFKNLMWFLIFVYRKVKECSFFVFYV